MAAELVETSRLWARVNGEDRAGVGRAARRAPGQTHLQRAALGAQAGAVMAYEKVTLYGVPIVAERKVGYGRVDPELSPRPVHPQRAGRGRLGHPPPVLPRQPAAARGGRGARAPAPGAATSLVDDETLFAFYDERVPSEVVTGAPLRLLVEEGAARDADLLTFTRRCWSRDARRGRPRTTTPTPGRRRADLRLSYQFEPGTDADGVTVHIPLPVLNQVAADGFDWQVPGLREDLVTELIRSLPKACGATSSPRPTSPGRCCPT